MPTPPPRVSLRAVLAFCRANAWRILLISALILLPCFWHAHIEAGDLGSHVYNAWLAQLIAKGQAPGLYIVPQWSNVLFDVSLYHAANWFGLAAAERLMVSLCVLIFFWGAFAFLAAAALRAPWFMVPVLAMLAYGWVFHMGFFNYYLSVGLAFFGIALLWRCAWPGAMLAILPAMLAFLAHPVGFVWLVCAACYLIVAGRLGKRTRWIWFSAALIAVIGLADWFALRYQADRLVFEPWYFLNGADQLVLFGARYRWLFWLAIVFGAACFASVFWNGSRARSFRLLQAPLELWLILFAACQVLPSSVKFGEYAAEAGFLLARLTLLAAVAALAALACVEPRRWHLAGWLAAAAVFFVFVYQDTGKLSAMESNAGALVAELSPGHRVLATMAAPEGSRIYYIEHMVDRACISHCFAYWNYEPASGQFRVRAATGNAVATAVPGLPMIGQDGRYQIPADLLPVAEIYQCAPRDFTKLCLREISGEHLRAQPSNGAEQ